MYYAEINKNNKVKALLSTDRPIDAPHMIEIDSFDGSVLGKIYSGGKFVDDPTPIPVTGDQKADEVMATVNVAELDKTDIGKAVKALLYKSGLLKPI